jgi:exopolysaccharide biosynthesis polyprenyl glycosylphosphotransferase
MKRSELFFGFLLVPVDAVAVLAAFAVAYAIRSRAEVVAIWPFDEFLRFIVALLPLWTAVFALEGLYNVRTTRRGLDELRGITLGVLSGIMLVVAWLFLTRTFFFSRLVILYALGFAILFVAAGRWAVRALQRWLYRANIGVHRIALVGANDTTYTLVEELARNRSLGYHVVGCFTATQPPRGGYRGLPLLGSIERFAKQVRSLAIDDLVIADPTLTNDQLLALIETCEQERIDVRQAPSFVGVRTLRFDVTDLAGVPILEYHRTPLDGWGRIAKRFVDVVVASIGLIILSPLFLLIAIAVTLDSRGPIFYRNTRIGEGAAAFETLKFRTMQVALSTGDGYGGAGALRYERALIRQRNTRQGALYKIADDPRVTRVGRWLRRFSLDEFPQLWNVVKGEMSLVGPRPHQPREVARYEPWQRKLLSVKPGITGLAAVSGRSDIDFDDEARLDMSYIERWSPWEDVKILLRTPLAVIQPRKVV